MNFVITPRRLFVPERWVVVGYCLPEMRMFTPHPFRGTQGSLCYHSYNEAMGDVQDAFNTPGRLSDEFRRATDGWTFQAMPINDGVTNGILRAVAAGGL